MPTINAIGNATAGLFGDLVGATGFNTITIHGMPTGAPVFTGVGLGVLKTTRNMGAAGAGQSVKAPVGQQDLAGETLAETGPGQHHDFIVIPQWHVIEVDQ